jgi:hypothetical protein
MGASSISLGAASVSVVNSALAQVGSVNPSVNEALAD